MNDLDVLEYNGPGYKPAMAFGEWRVAFLNDAERFRSVEKLERHLLTDEVFVLLAGKAVLFTGKERKQTPMEPGKLYNVRQGVWHQILVSPDAKVLIVENNDTGPANTEYLAV